MIVHVNEQGNRTALVTLTATFTVDDAEKYVSYGAWFHLYDPGERGFKTNISNVTITSEDELDYEDYTSPVTGIQAILEIGKSGDPQLGVVARYMVDDVTYNTYCTAIDNAQSIEVIKEIIDSLELA